MNQFGGNWTEKKMQIVQAYAKAYLTIMNKQSWAKTLYFDGFAGSGTISEQEAETNNQSELWVSEIEDKEAIKKGTALRILDITEPKPFDLYYFVEKKEANKKALEKIIETEYFGRNAHVVQEDCNVKLKAMAEYLRENQEYRCLAFIDPYGMAVKWSAIETLKKLGIDLWILVPTGIGANRVLVVDGDIPEKWWQTLETFLGMTREEIKNYFYKEVKTQTLFDEEETNIIKEKNAVAKVGKLYAKRLGEIFDYVSESYVLTNTTNSVMYHFMMATNNKYALGIANDVIKPKYKI